VTDTLQLFWNYSLRGTIRTENLIKNTIKIIRANRKLSLFEFKKFNTYILYVLYKNETDYISIVYIVVVR
jgi:hypothetical protein